MCKLIIQRRKNVKMEDKRIRKTKKNLKATLIKMLSELTFRRFRSQNYANGQIQAVLPSILITAINMHW